MKKKMVLAVRDIFARNAAAVIINHHTHGSPRPRDPCAWAHWQAAVLATTPVEQRKPWRAITGTPQWLLNKYQ